MNRRLDDVNQNKPVVVGNVCFRADAKPTSTPDFRRIPVRRLWGRKRTGSFMPFSDTHLGRATGKKPSWGLGPRSRPRRSASPGGTAPEDAEMPSVR